MIQIHHDHPTATRGDNFSRMPASADELPRLHAHDLIAAGTPSSYRRLADDTRADGQRREVVAEGSPHAPNDYAEHRKA